VNVDFKFEIGQSVYLRQELKRWHELFGKLASTANEHWYQLMGDLAAKERRPFGFLVIERHMQQCYGGIQLHYHLRAGSGLIAFTEPELTAEFDDVEVVGPTPAVDAVDPHLQDSGPTSPRDKSSS